MTTGWNKNDQVFDPIELWTARKTPEDKPINMRHDCSDIIGHIIANEVIDESGAVIPDDITAEGLPAKFHIATASVLYKEWDKPVLQLRMDELLKEIAEGKWFVSMEVLAKAFDYGLRAPDGKMSVVARNSQTAFLTQHLRHFGGTGIFKDYQVGILFRQMCFNAQGLTETPANPESIIFPAGSDPYTATTSFDDGHEKQLSMDLVYLSVDASASTNAVVADATLTRENIMADEKLISDLKTEIETLKASLRDNDQKQLKSQLEAAKAELKAKSEEVAAKATELETVKASETALKTELETLKATLKTETDSHKKTSDELVGLKASVKKSDRLAKVKATIKSDDAVALAETLYDLSDEKFEANLKALARLVPAPVQDKPESAKAETKVDTSAEKLPEDDAVKTGAKASELEIEKKPGLVTGEASDLTVITKAIASFLEL